MIRMINTYYKLLVRSLDLHTHEYAIQQPPLQTMNQIIKLDFIICFGLGF